MFALFDVYSNAEPEKALDLAREMVTAYPTSETLTAEGIEQHWQDKDWPISLHRWAAEQIRTNKYWIEGVEYQSSLVRAAGLLKKKNISEAALSLEKAKPPKWFDEVNIQTARLDLLKAEAFYIGGDTVKAYDHLLKKAAASAPNEALNTALLDYGAHLGKGREEVDEEIWKLRSAKPMMKDFELHTYDGRTVRLSDYRGRPVLVNFWYPTCGSCRAEFPYIENLIKKYGARGFSVLAINILPSQDLAAPSIIRDYPFVSLRVPGVFREWSTTNYNIGQCPANFLLDAKGRIIFAPLLYNAENRRAAEAEIAELLKRAGPQDSGSGH
jgi:thiol-disulfide isomerase/thioredoxin